MERLWLHGGLNNMLRRCGCSVAFIVLALGGFGRRSRFCPCGGCVQIASCGSKLGLSLAVGSYGCGLCVVGG